MARDPERFAFGVVNSVLGGGMSSRLFQEVREKRGLAYSVYSYHSMFAETGMFAAYAGTTPSKAEEVLRIVRGQIEDVAAGGLTDEELARAKGHMKGSLVLSLEDTSGRMSRIGKSEVAQGEILSVDELLRRVDSVTREEAERAARRVFERPMALAVIGPFRGTAFKGWNLLPPDAAGPDSGDATDRQAGDTAQSSLPRPPASGCRRLGACQVPAPLPVPFSHRASLA